MKMNVDFDEDFEKELQREIADAVEKAMNCYAPPHEQKEWMSLGEAASYLNVSRNTLHKFILDGLKITMIDKTTRVKRSDADHYMLQHQI
ncbi:helix-turn-helix domain-containing protein [Schleiferilactobacillus perolens]|jgi:excisionase family DNA binding protein|uniref:helix-turn-helix domain-containing protein n=1 Tax=Schleiferilactobacillus perolens TaxID=100468 RepID=UPI002354B367|nr:helix-turn-helix domain-containing protein [Schleiferilactobacillus perolens]MCI2172370.1 helix-turn-helix domain-containing protein [Schleiferilactobacillus perolens]